MKIRQLLTAGTLILLVNGCAAYTVMNSDRYSRSSEKVPAEYYPPAGQCRIWYQNRSASQQPAPTSCDKLESRVPDNAELLRG